MANERFQTANTMGGKLLQDLRERTAENNPDPVNKETKENEGWGYNMNMGTKKWYKKGVNDYGLTKDDVIAKQIELGFTPKAEYAKLSKEDKKDVNVADGYWGDASLKKYREDNDIAVPDYEFDLDKFKESTGLTVNSSSTAIGRIPKNQFNCGSSSQCGTSSTSLAYKLANKDATNSEIGTKRLTGVDAWRYSDAADKGEVENTWIADQGFYDLSNDYKYVKKTKKQVKKNKDGSYVRDKDGHRVYEDVRDTSDSARQKKYNDYLNTEVDGVTRRDSYIADFISNVKSGKVKKGDVVQVFDSLKGSHMNQGKTNDGVAHVMTFLGLDTRGEPIFVDSFGSSKKKDARFQSGKITDLSSGRYVPVGSYNTTSTVEKPTEEVTESNPVVETKDDTVVVDEAAVAKPSTKGEVAAESFMGLERVGMQAAKGLRSRLSNTKALGSNILANGTPEGDEPQLGAELDLEEISNLEEDEELAAADRDITVDEALVEYSANLDEFEGNLSNAGKFHKPTSGSGWTIGQGLDLSTQTPESLAEKGVPQRFIDFATTNNAYGKKNVSIPTTGLPAAMTKAEFATVSANIASDSRTSMSKLLEDNPNLTAKDLAMMQSVKHWGGGFKGSGEGKTTRFKSSMTETGQQSGELFSPIQEAIDSDGGIDNTSLLKSLGKLRHSVMMDSPLHTEEESSTYAGDSSVVKRKTYEDRHDYKTLTKYIDHIGGDSTKEYVRKDVIDDNILPVSEITPQSVNIQPNKNLELGIQALGSDILGLSRSRKPFKSVTSNMKGDGDDITDKNGIIKGKFKDPSTYNGKPKVDRSDLTLKDITEYLEEGAGRDYGTLNNPNNDLGYAKYPAAIVGHASNLGGRVLSSLPKLLNGLFSDDDRTEGDATEESSELLGSRLLAGYGYKPATTFAKAAGVVKRIPAVGAIVEEISNQIKLASETNEEYEERMTDVDASVSKVRSKMDAIFKATGDNAQQSESVNIPDKYRGMSPAEIAEKIQTKYKDYPRESIGYESMMDELQQLATMQTEFKQTPEGSKQAEEINAQVNSGGTNQLAAGSNLLVGGDDLRLWNTFDVNKSFALNESEVIGKGTARGSDWFAKLGIQDYFPKQKSQQVVPESEETYVPPEGLEKLDINSIINQDALDNFITESQSVDNIDASRDLDGVTTGSNYGTTKTNTNQQTMDTTKDYSSLFAGAEALTNIAGAVTMKNNMVAPQRVDPIKFNPQVHRSKFDMQPLVDQTMQAQATSGYQLRESGLRGADLAKAMTKSQFGSQQSLGKIDVQRQQLDAADESSAMEVENAALKYNTGNENKANIALNAEQKLYDNKQDELTASIFGSAAGALNDVGNKNYAKVLAEIQAKTASITT